MISLNTDEKRNLQFEVTIQGIDHKELQGALTFEVASVKYGFPVKILSDHISVTVPPLDDIIKKGLRDGKVIECNLDIFGNGFYLNPWSGKFKIKTPVRMEAKMRYSDDIISESPSNDDVDSNEKSITATLKEFDDNSKEEVIYEKPDNRTGKLSMDEIDRDDLLKELFSKVESKLFQKIDNSNFKKEQTESLIKDIKETPKDKVQALVESKLNKINNVVDNFLKSSNKKQIVEKKKPVRSTKRTSSLLEDYGKTLVKKKPVQQTEVDSNNPITLMESFGMKNPKIQKMMLDRAKNMGGDDVISTLKHMLNLKTQTQYGQYVQNKAENVS